MAIYHRMEPISRTPSPTRPLRQSFTALPPLTEGDEPGVDGAASTTVVHDTMPKTPAGTHGNGDGGYYGTPQPSTKRKRKPRKSQLSLGSVPAYKRRKLQLEEEQIRKALEREETEEEEEIFDVIRVAGAVLSRPSQVGEQGLKAPGRRKKTPGRKVNVTVGAKEVGSPSGGTKQAARKGRTPNMQPRKGLHSGSAKKTPYRKVKENTLKSLFNTASKDDEIASLSSLSDLEDTERTIGEDTREIVSTEDAPDQSHDTNRDMNGETAGTAATIAFSPEEAIKEVNKEVPDLQDAAALENIGSGVAGDQPAPEGLVECGIPEAIEADIAPLQIAIENGTSKEDDRMRTTPNGIPNATDVPNIAAPLNAGDGTGFPDKDAPEPVAEAVNAERGIIDAGGEAFAGPGEQQTAQQVPEDESRSRVVEKVEVRKDPVQPIEPPPASPTPPADVLHDVSEVPEAPEEEFLPAPTQDAMEAEEEAAAFPEISDSMSVTEPTHALEEIAVIEKEQTTQPVDKEHPAPKEQTTQPVDEEQAAPKEQTTQPVDEEQAASKEQTTQPVDEEHSEPKEQITQPVDEEQAASKEQTTQPVDEEQAAPKEQTTQPVDEDQAVPKEQTTQLVDEEQAAPKEQTTQPAEEEQIEPEEQIKQLATEEQAAPKEQTTQLVNREQTAPKEHTETVETQSAASLTPTTYTVKELGTLKIAVSKFPEHGETKHITGADIFDAGYGRVSWWALCTLIDKAWGLDLTSQRLLVNWSYRLRRQEDLEKCIKELCKFGREFHEIIICDLVRGKHLPDDAKDIIRRLEDRDKDFWKGKDEVSKKSTKRKNSIDKTNEEMILLTSGSRKVGGPPGLSPSKSPTHPLQTPASPVPSSNSDRKKKRNKISGRKSHPTVTTYGSDTEAADALQALKRSATSTTTATSPVHKKRATEADTRAPSADAVSQSGSPETASLRHRENSRSVWSSASSVSTNRWRSGVIGITGANPPPALFVSGKSESQPTLTPADSKSVMPEECGANATPATELEATVLAQSVDVQATAEAKIAEQQIADEAKPAVTEDWQPIATVQEAPTTKNEPTFSSDLPEPKAAEASPVLSRGPTKQLPTRIKGKPWKIPAISGTATGDEAPPGLIERASKPVHPAVGPSQPAIANLPRLNVWRAVLTDPSRTSKPTARPATPDSGAHLSGWKVVSAVGMSPLEKNKEEDVARTAPDIPKGDTEVQEEVTAGASNIQALVEPEPMDLDLDSQAVAAIAPVAETTVEKPYTELSEEAVPVPVRVQPAPALSVNASSTVVSFAPNNVAPPDALGSLGLAQATQAPAAQPTVGSRTNNTSPEPSMDMEQIEESAQMLLWAASGGSPEFSPSSQTFPGAHTANLSKKQKVIEGQKKANDKAPSNDRPKGKGRPRKRITTVLKVSPSGLAGILSGTRLRAGPSMGEQPSGGSGKAHMPPTVQKEEGLVSTGFTPVNMPRPQPYRRPPASEAPSSVARWSPPPLADSVAQARKIVASKPHGRLDSLSNKRPGAGLSVPRPPPYGSPDLTATRTSVSSPSSASASPQLGPRKEGARPLVYAPIPRPGPVSNGSGTSTPAAAKSTVHQAPGSQRMAPLVPPSNFLFWDGSSDAQKPEGPPPQPAPNSSLAHSWKLPTIERTKSPTRPLTLTPPHLRFPADDVCFTIHRHQYPDTKLCVYGSEIPLSSEPVRFSWEKLSRMLTENLRFNDFHEVLVVNYMLVVDDQDSFDIGLPRYERENEGVVCAADELGRPKDDAIKAMIKSERKRVREMEGE